MQRKRDLKSGVTLVFVLVMKKRGLSNDGSNYHTCDYIHSDTDVTVLQPSYIEI